MIVSGAAGEFGRAFVTHFIDKGLGVLALDSNADKLADLASNGPPDGQMLTACVDLADPVAVKAALELVRAPAAIGILVNAVGLIWSEPVVSIKRGVFQAHDLDSWDRVIKANLTAPFVLSSRVAARMARSGGGVIVNFSSIAARGNSGQAAYSAAKAGIAGLTRSMAQELGPLGVRVNAIAPGFIDVTTTREALAGTVLEDYVRRTPLRRLGSLMDLIGAVDCLVENRFLNGVVLDLDGGLRL